MIKEDFYLCTGLYGTAEGKLTAPQNSILDTPFSIVNPGFSRISRKGDRVKF